MVLVRRMPGDVRLLRGVRVGLRALRDLREEAAARETPAGQPEVVADAGGAGVGAKAAGEVPGSAAARNGPDLDRGDALADVPCVAAEPRGGAGARRGE